LDALHAKTFTLRGQHGIGKEIFLKDKNKNKIDEKSYMVSKAQEGYDSRTTITRGASRG
jgi:hypothetical protein